MAFSALIALPCEVRGPVLRAAFSLFAAILAGVLTAAIVARELSSSAPLPRRWSPTAQRGQLGRTEQERGANCQRVSDAYERRKGDVLGAALHALQMAEVHASILSQRLLR